MNHSGSTPGADGPHGRREPTHRAAVGRSHRHRPRWSPVAWSGLVLLASIGAAAAALTWRQADGYRWAELPVPSVGRTGFTRLGAAETGVTFTNVLTTERGVRNRNLLSGSGVALGDVDGDGWCDVYFCGLDTPNRLFRNLGGWRFEDITEAAGVACAGQDSTSAAFADVNGDGRLDLLVGALGGGLRLFENDGAGRFREITAAAGLASRSGTMSLAIADVDGDGDLDLYVVNYRPTTMQDELTTTYRIGYRGQQPVVLAVNGVPTTTPEYTNRFVVTASGSVQELGEPDVLYLNDGRGRFTPVDWTGGAFLDAAGRPLADAPRDWGLHAQFHDFTGDGAPDLYVCNDLFSPDRIWVNDGTGRFRALDPLAVRTTSTFSMGVDFGDLDRDGHVDFFVVDMLSRDHVKQLTQVPMTRPVAPPIGAIDNQPQERRNTLFRNRGDTTFAEVGQFAGVEASEWSWGPIFLDVDLDGYEDVLITNGQLQDFNNTDLNVAIEQAHRAGGLTREQLTHLVRQFPRYTSPNVLFRNRGDWTFEDVAPAWGFAQDGISQGMALADLDQDGDLDVVMNNLNEAAGLYRNDTVAPRLAVRLKGRPPNIQGIGARLRVLGGPVPQTQEILGAGRYLSADDPMRTFAAWQATNRFTLEVTWRNGRRSVIQEARANCLYEIDEAAAAVAGAPSQTVATPTKQGQQPPATLASPFFEDVSHRLDHVHHEDPFDDFERQPLLPKRLSQLGPGVGWLDLNGDGHDDLVIGSGRGGRLAVYWNDGRGGFNLATNEVLARPVTRDQTTVLGSGPMLLLGASNYEDGQTNGGCLRLYDLRRGVSGESVLGQSSSAGPLAMADVDGDGQLDVFIGGRCLPGHYPAPADSLLLRNQGGRLSLARRFEKLGLVSGAVFTDLEGDGAPDLALACEWGPVRLFRNNAGRFEEWDAPLSWGAVAAAAGKTEGTLEEKGPSAGAATSALVPLGAASGQSAPGHAATGLLPSRLSELTGWWNGINAGDLDGDGRLDLVVSNWGLNSRYRASVASPRRLYYGDFDGNGTVDLVEAHFDATLRQEVPDRWLLPMAEAMPFLREQWTTFEAFARASVGELLGQALATAGRVEVNTLASMLLLNRGDHFQARPLPDEAQLAPAFGVCVGDFDGDGAEDVFLSQNFFATTPEYARCDAGRGLWLRGDGRGGLTPVPGQQSGVRVYGEQRGCALGDFDEDGRVDLVVTQNGNATRLFRNVGARPGLRVRLKGPPGNPAGIGATIRLKFGERHGPAREVHAGAGYWSHDSVTQVLGTPEAPTHVWVRWPGGHVEETTVPPGVREVQIEHTPGAAAP